MRSSELIALLESEDEIGVLRQAIAEAMPAFRRGLALRGGSAPVRLSSEGRSMRVAGRHVKRICEEFLAGRLDQEETAYLMSALELCPDFEIASEKLADVIGLLADPVPDSTIARQRVEGVLRSI